MIVLGQKYQNTALDYPPSVEAKMAGDTTTINSMTIRKWYLDLSEVPQSISDDDLKKIVFDYLVPSYELLEFEQLMAGGFSITKNRLCKRFSYSMANGHFVIHVYIDIQNGEIIVTRISRIAR